MRIYSLNLGVKRLSSLMVGQIVGKKKRKKEESPHLVDPLLVELKTITLFQIQAVIVVVQAIVFGFDFPFTGQHEIL